MGVFLFAMIAYDCVSLHGAEICPAPEPDRNP
jgi:hypothetical protein